MPETEDPYTMQTPTSDTVTTRPAFPAVVRHLLPAAFCGFISLLALVGSATVPDSAWWRPAFFAFLPMCFVFVGAATVQTTREVDALRLRVEALEHRTG